MDDKMVELCDFDDTARLLNLAGSLKVEDATLKDIFDNRKYAPESLYIL